MLWVRSSMARVDFELANYEIVLVVVNTSIVWKMKGSEKAFSIVSQVRVQEAILKSTDELDSWCEAAILLTLAFCWQPLNVAHQRVTRAYNHH